MSDDEPDGGSRRRALAGIVVIVLIIVAVVFVIGRLRESARMQDCLASGRTNCAPIETPARGG
ncbi:MAG: hypothetical protein J0H14_03515 [Alphaproteobacteria bacterium]|nr:hypothetical protein [Alphaproteobacteria bacterium]